MTNQFDKQIMPKWAVIALAIVVIVVGTYNGANTLELIALIVLIVLLSLILTYFGAKITGKFNNESKLGKAK